MYVVLVVFSERPLAHLDRQGGYILYPSTSLAAVLNATMEFYRTSTDPKTQIITTTAGAYIGGSTALVLLFHDAAEKPDAFNLFTNIPYIINTMRAQPFSNFIDSIPSEVVALTNIRGAFATISTSALTMAFLDAIKNETDVRVHPIKPFSRMLTLDRQWDA